MLEFELVLPCYNESKSIEALIRRAIDAAVQAGYSGERFQLVLVENGSVDNSSKVMDALKTTPLGAWFRKISVTPNQGYGFGLMTGLATTTAKYVAWSHADEQCDPKDAFTALGKLKTSQDPNLLVKGTRLGRNWKDFWVSRVFELFARILLGLKMREVNAQPKVLQRDLLKLVVHPPKGFMFDLYVLYCASKAGYRMETVDVLLPPRAHGVSHWASNFFSRYKTILGSIRYMWDLSRKEGRI